MSAIPFDIAANDGAARTGAVTTAHGAFQTPAFMPVGTAATVKAMRPEDIAATGTEIILANTYHLMLRPGADLIRDHGGLHKFMNWPGPILTDSGGYQVMSLAKLRKISEEGVAFQSHIDGDKHLLTPESATGIQLALGADIVMAFDECTPFPASQTEAEQSMELSMRWAARSKAAFESAKADGAALFGIVQGGVYDDLRKRSAAALTEIGFPGYAVGGLAVGEGQAAMFEVLDVTLAELPADRPRYLMGIGKPDDIIGAVMRGIDMFDCVLPTRSGRTGQAFTRDGAINLKNARFKDDATPIDAECGCRTCRGHSRAYLNHLIRADEILGPMLLTEHNLTFYQDLMRDLRAEIGEGRLQAFSTTFLARYKGGDQERPRG